MAGWIFRGANGAGEQVGLGLLFYGFERPIGKWSFAGLECFTHEFDTQFAFLISPGLPHRYLDGLER